MDYKACVILIFLHFYLILNHVEAGNNEQIVIKTIKSKDGDIFDCIDIMSQQTFLDPRFKNHKIQMKPTSFPVSINEEAPSNETSIQAEINAVPCPLGTIPIWRNQKKNITSSYIKDKLQNIFGNVNRGYHVARVRNLRQNFGASATLNVYKPEVKLGPEERFSGSSVSINSNRHLEYDDSIEVGWFVRPGISGDNDVHVHIFWRDANTRKECINLGCPGFVQIAKDFALGSRITPVSIYEGPQFEISVEMYKDFNTGDWWLTWGKERKVIGYWIKSIFKYIDDGNNAVSWGGTVVYQDGEESPAMGSGYFPHEGYGRAAFVRDPKYFDAKHNRWESPIDYQGNERSVHSPKCYDMGNGYFVGNPKHRILQEFYFGGPAGCER